MPPRAPWRRQGGADSNEEPLVSQPLGNLSTSTRHHFIATTSEFVGTFLFLLFALGGTHVVNSASDGGIPLNANPSKLLYIALCFGMSLGVNVWAFFRIGGGQFNPAVSLAMFLTGNHTFVRTILVIIAQILGAIAASAVVVGLLPGHGIVATTQLGGGISTVQGLFLEMFLTAELIFVIFMLASEKHLSTAVAPVGIGLALFICHLVGIYYTGASLNPARSFGPQVVNGSFPSEHWIYWLGPILGALLASAFYKLVKGVDFNSISPGIDEPARHYRKHADSVLPTNNGDGIHDHGGA